MSAAYSYHLATVDTARADNWIAYGPPAPDVRYDSYPTFSFIPGENGGEEPVRYGDFILDLDCKSDVLKSVSEARMVMEHFERVYSIAPEAWQIFLSGSKGAHLVLSAKVLGMEAGHFFLPKIYKRLALDLNELAIETIDLSMYHMGTGKPFRLPNRRRDNGLFKVLLTFDELCGITGIEDYKDLCSAPRPMLWPEAERNELLAEKVAVYTKEAEKAAREKPEPLDMKAAERLREAVPPCIAIISEASKMPKGAPTFNAVAMQLIGYAVTAELTEAQSVELCEPAIRNYPSPSKTSYAERIRDFKTKYRHMAAHGKGFSCAAVLALGFGVFDCNTCSVQRKEAASEGTTACRFKLIRAGDIEAKPPRWIVRDILEEHALALIFGDPGCGKSFWALDLALSIATGTSFHGHAVEQGAVIYIAGEGQNGIKRRLIAWSMARGVSHDTAPLYISLTPTALTDKEGLAMVTEAIDVVADEAGMPVLIVIDTLARNYGPADENSTADMSRAIGAMDSIRVKYRTTILLVHHSGHGDKTRARGAMALKGALDAEYRMGKDDTGTIRLETVKMKESDLPEPMAYRLRPVDLDNLTDPATGEIVTSAVLEPTSYEPRAAKGKQGRGKWQTRALEILIDLWSARQGTEGEAARITVDAWRFALKNENFPRQRIVEVTRSLIEVGAVHEAHGFVSPVF